MQFMFFTMLALISLTMTSIVAATIFLNKKLKDTHPSMLIALMSILEFIICQNVLVYRLNTVYIVCYFNLNDLYYHSVWAFLSFFTNDASYFTMEDAIKHLVRGNLLIFQLAMQTILCLNTCLCIDLYLVYKNPFYPPNRRTRNFLVMTFAAVMMMIWNSSSMFLTPKDFFNSYI